MKLVENLITEYKSLRKVTKGDAGFKDLAITSVRLANAQCGDIIVGIEGDVPLDDTRKTIYKMVKDEILSHTSDKTYRKYWLAKKNRNEKEIGNRKL